MATLIFKKYESNQLCKLDSIPSHETYKTINSTLKIIIKSNYISTIKERLFTTTKNLYLIIQPNNKTIH